MRSSVLDLVARLAPVMWVADPIFEIGSRQVSGGGNSAADLRKFFPGRLYTVVDAEPGPGVDCVMDISRFKDRGSPLLPEAGTLLCLEVIEHVPDPVNFFAGLALMLKPNGWGLITAPYRFPIHSLPDYWRYTPMGLELRLKQAGFNNWAIFWPEPNLGPDTVGALVWGDQPSLPELERGKAVISDWCVRWSRPSMPQPGEPYLICPHESRSIFKQASDTICFQRPGVAGNPTMGSARWFLACVDCIVGSEGVVNKIQFVGEGVA